MESQYKHLFNSTWHSPEILAGLKCGDQFHSHLSKAFIPWIPCLCIGNSRFSKHLITSKSQTHLSNIGTSFGATFNLPFVHESVCFSSFFPWFFLWIGVLKSPGFLLGETKKPNALGIDRPNRIKGGTFAIEEWWYLGSCASRATYRVVGWKARPALNI